MDRNETTLLQRRVTFVSFYPFLNMYLRWSFHSRTTLVIHAFRRYQNEIVSQCVFQCATYSVLGQERRSRKLLVWPVLRHVLTIAHKDFFLPELSAILLWVSSDFQRQDRNLANFKKSGQSCWFAPWFSGKNFCCNGFFGLPKQSGAVNVSAARCTIPQLGVHKTKAICHPHRAAARCTIVDLQTDRK